MLYAIVTLNVTSLKRLTGAIKTLHWPLAEYRTSHLYNPHTPLAHTHTHIQITHRDTHIYANSRVIKVKHLYINGKCLSNLLYIRTYH